MANTRVLRPIESDMPPNKWGTYLLDRGPTHIPRFHQGEDYAVPTGTPLFASGEGTVTFSTGTNPGTGRTGGGWYVTVRYTVGPYQVTVTTMHMSSIYVHPGDTVTAAMIIGLSGGQAGADGAGVSTGPHVHVQITVNGMLAKPSDTLASRTATSPAGTDTPTPLIPTKEEDMAKSTLIRTPNGSVALASDDGDFVPLSSVDQMQALVISGAVDADANGNAKYVQLADTFAWDLLTQVQARKAALAAGGTPTQVAAALAPLLVPSLVAALTTRTALTREDIAAATEEAIRGVFADAAIK